MPKKIREHSLMPLLEKYMKDLKRGKQLQKNGKKIKPNSLRNYTYLYKLLVTFSTDKNFNLRIKTISAGKSEFETEKKYWKKFFLAFTTYLYEDLGHSDNYVGSIIKLLRAFFNFLNNEAGLNIGTFHKNFYVTSEEIEIIVLSPERLNYLINSKELEEKLSMDLKKVKDVFVFGCAVALRHSDLMALNTTNIENINGRIYLNVQSKKTDTFTHVKLPPHAIDILNRYKGLPKNRLIPYYNKGFLNKKLKLLMEAASFTEPIKRTRQQRGIAKTLFVNGNKKTPYRFCDAISSHTMRRTAITTMLSLGMSEQAVRKISGHAAGSKEFYRYVNFAQAYMDNEIDMVHEKLAKKQLEFA